MARKSKYIERCSFRCTAQTIEDLENIADLEDKDVSDLLREIVTASLKRRKQKYVGELVGEE